MEENIRTAAEEGDINMLYNIIQVHSPNILEQIGDVPFIDTPLHIAAFHGRIPFAKELMRLKPSFTRKLNQQGFTPMHLALFNGQTKMVLRFLDSQPDLVRVQGREGKTPLHHVAERGDLHLLSEFLSACPTSIQDVTIHGHTALHIAVKNEKVEALDVLVGGVRRACYKGCSLQEKVIMNWKDEEGKTALHIATATNQLQAVKLLLDSGLIDVNVKDDEGTTALHIATATNQPQVVKLLVKSSGINVNAKNSEGLTALDMLGPHNKQVEEILVQARALNAYSLPSQVKPNSYYDHLKSKLSFKERRKISMIRLRNNVNNDTRDVILIVATLIVTATYQSALSPPGGLSQENNFSTNNVSNISLATNTTTTSNTTESQSAGTVIMSTASFFIFYLINSLTLLITTLVIFFLLPGDQISWLIILPLYLFSLCYMYSWQVISPAVASIFVIVIWCLIYSCACIWLILQSKHSRKIENQNTS